MANIDEHLPSDSSLQMDGQRMRGAFAIRALNGGMAWMALAGSAALRATHLG